MGLSKLDNRRQNKFQHHHIHLIISTINSKISNNDQCYPVFEQGFLWNKAMNKSQCD